MPVMPQRDALRALYDAAVQEIADTRNQPQLTTGFYAQVGDAVFDKGFNALEDFCRTDDLRPAVPRIHVVSTPVGSGKTYFSLALATALVRLGVSTEDAPYGCVLVVDRIAKAEEIHGYLHALVPGKIAIWTSDHDKARKATVGTKVKDPATRHHVDELADYPVVIVTHAFYSGKRGTKAKQVMRNGQLQPRALTIVDEHPNQVDVYDIQLSQAEEAREHVLNDEERAESVRPHLDALVSFMRARADAQRASSLEKPSDHQDWSTARNLEWFVTQDAREYARANPSVSQVFDFARAMVKGYAFVARDRSGQGGTHFVGYESKLIQEHGALLLDATADIDGVSQLCIGREPPSTVPARYDNLSIVHVAQPTKQRLSVFLKTRKNHVSYVRWMEDVIRTHMEPGQRGLVVCKKVLFDFESVPSWPQGDPRFSDRPLFTERYAWEIEGRHLCAIHWGTGIGDNTWKDADVVFLFDEFHIPRRTVIATTQGLQDHKATQGDLASMRAQNAKAPAVELISEGRLLRWNKQMSLRGRARCFDEEGVCGEQKLVWTGDRDRLLLNYDRLFPGAQITLTKADTGRKQNRADALLSLLSDPSLPNVVKTSWVSQQLNRSWREVVSGVNTASVMKALEVMGWRYVSQRGRGGSRFERIERRNEDLSNTEAMDTSPSNAPLNAILAARAITKAATTVKAA
jgi:hypothetical protein